jgi:hypothetical protein
MKMLTEKQFMKMIDAAHKRDSENQAIEETSGFLPPQRCPLDNHFRTVVTMLELSIRSQEWPTACDALVVLEQAIERFAGFVAAIERLPNAREKTQ